MQTTCHTMPQNYEEHAYDDSEETPVNVPGIDECDHLFNCTDRKGNVVLCLRVQELPGGGYALAATVDTEHFSDNHPLPRDRAESLSECADIMVEIAREYFGRGKFCQCGDTKKNRTL